MVISIGCNNVTYSNEVVGKVRTQFIVKPTRVIAPKRKKSHAQLSFPMPPTMNPTSPSSVVPNITIHFEPIYRVMLHYTPNQWDSVGVVARKIVNAVPVLSMMDAKRIAEFTETHDTSIVITAPLDEASVYEEALRRNGFRTSLEMA